jgi:small-conductance mechanosensitive channel
MSKLFYMMQRLALIGLLLSSSFSFSEEEVIDVNPNPQLELQERLIEVQTLLTERRTLQSRLQRQLNNNPNSSDGGELSIQLEALNKEVSNLRKTFEHLVVGGADLETIEEEPQEFNWQKEMALVTKPLLDTLKSLTEKPRKIEQLKSAIALNQERKAIITKALASLETNFTLDPPKNLRVAIQDVKDKWEQRLSENSREFEFVSFQLATLQGTNISWYETIKDNSTEFLTGRGLTLLIAIIASIMMWMFTRFLLWFVQWLQRGKKRSFKLKYRLASYAFTLLTTLLIITTIILVFYVRGDILLLALSLLLLAFAVLRMRIFLPEYIAEAKLLLNVGGLREGERTVYNGLPWEVCNINIYTILRNPELEGVIRLPISALHEMISRPCRKESWFPSSKGDFVLLPGNLMGEVIMQTPEMVQLKVKGGMHHYLPTTDFIGMGVLNLSRGESFVITTIFGIDYAHQGIALSDVPNAFQTAVQENINSEGLIDHLNEVVVELKGAGASSIDYLIIINVKPTAAALYFKLERILQQTCIKVCTQQGWGIPFPQITVHQASVLNHNVELPKTLV